MCCVGRKHLSESLIRHHTAWGVGAVVGGVVALLPIKIRPDFIGGIMDGCAVGAFPKFTEEQDQVFLKRFKIRKLMSSGILYGSMAGVEAWEDAGLAILPKDAEAPDWDSGCIMGGGVTGIESIGFGIKGSQIF